MKKIPLWQLVLEVMKCGEWLTSDQVRDAVGRGRIPTIEARIRDLRKPEHGGHDIRSRKRDGAGGQHEYRWIPEAKEQGELFKTNNDGNPYRR